MDRDGLVFVIDLRAAAMDEVAREVDAALAGAFVPRVLPEIPTEPIGCVALLVDDGDPVALPIEPTDDVRWLDALARLVRFAVLRGETVSAIAKRYGGPYERAMSLPGWARGELDAARAERLPDAVRRALAAS